MNPSHRLGTEAQPIIDENGFQFFSCYKCGDLISAIELNRALNTNGMGCRCGCMKVQPVQVKAEQYTQKNVVEMAIYLKIAEEDYRADFVLETLAIGWTAAQQEEGMEKIHSHFKEMLG